MQLLSAPVSQRGSIAAVQDDVKYTVELWRLDSSLTICRLRISNGLHSTHPPICTLPQPEHSSHIWPLSFFPNARLPALHAIITHKPCVLLFSFLFTIPPPSRVKKNPNCTQHTNVIYRHDLGEKGKISGVCRDPE